MRLLIYTIHYIRFNLFWWPTSNTRKYFITPTSFSPRQLLQQLQQELPILEIREEIADLLAPRPQVHVHPFLERALLYFFTCSWGEWKLNTTKCFLKFLRRCRIYSRVELLLLYFSSGLNWIGAKKSSKPIINDERWETELNFINTTSPRLSHGMSTTPDFQVKSGNEYQKADIGIAWKY